MATSGNPVPGDPSGHATPGTADGGDRSRPARILVVGGDPIERTRIAGHLGDRGHRCTHVGRLDDGLAAVRATRFELVLVHPTLPDGDGLDLVEFIRDLSAGAKTIVFAEDQTVSSTLAAVRRGAADVITEPRDLGGLTDRVESALQRTAWERRREDRMQRVQHVCRELQDSRRELSGRVDSLCREMLSAYEELTEQFDEVTMSTEFRTLMRMELDVEDALRTALEYMLTRTGPTNAAVFLPDVDGHFSLGAYVNYDCPRDTVEPVIDHLAQVLAPRLADEQGILTFVDADDFRTFAELDDSVFNGHDIVAFPCRHGDDCLAVAVLFRDDRDPFPPRLLSTIDALRTIFAEHLARIIDVHHRARPEWPEELADEPHGLFDEPGLEDDEPDWGYGGGLAA